MTLKSDAKFEEKLTMGSRNDMRNLVNFNASSGKFENLHFDVCEFSHKQLKVMLDESSVYNFQLKEYIFQTKVAHRISTFWTFHCLSEVAQIPHVIIEIRSQLLH